LPPSTDVAGDEGGDQDGQEEGSDEPEDDYNAAWEILDVARTIYAKIVEGLPEGEGQEHRLCLAECYLALGDVSLETGQYCLPLCTPALTSRKLPASRSRLLGSTSN
jgi:HAT1-interacting factor 1